MNYLFLEIYWSEQMVDIHGCAYQHIQFKFFWWSEEQSFAYFTYLDRNRGANSIRHSLIIHTHPYRINFFTDMILISECFGSHCLLLWWAFIWIWNDPRRWSWCLRRRKESFQNLLANKWRNMNNSNDNWIMRDLKKSFWTINIDIREKTHIISDHCVM